MNTMPDQLVMNELATSTQYLPHVRQLQFVGLIAPEDQLEEFMRGIKKAAALCPLIVRLRHRRTMKELKRRQKNGDRYDFNLDNLQHPPIHIKPAERSIYYRSDSQHEAGHPFHISGTDQGNISMDQ